MFAKRTQWNMSPNALSRKLNDYRKEGIQYLDLTISNPTRCGFQYPVNEILAAYHHAENLDYKPEPKGMIEARKAVCDFYQAKGHSLDPAHLILTASTSEAYSFLFKLLADPDDEILVPTPSYPLFDYLAGLNDVKVRPYSLFYDQRWCLDFQSIKDRITPRTQAMVLVNPNNPTGSSFTEIEYREIINICQAHNLPIISDEVFMDFPFAGKTMKSFLGEEGVLCFVLGGLSKTLALPQMKLSWIYASGPESILKESLDKLEMIADTYLSVNTPVQNALPELLRLSVVIQEQVLKRINDNQMVIHGFLPNLFDSECLQSEGGWSAILKLPWGIAEDKFTLQLLEEDKLYLHPGFFFDIPGNRSIVMSLLTDVKTMQQGLEILEKRIKGCLEFREE
jgi:aspartate/methionine/tyrosine aminotransferase